MWLLTGSTGDTQGTDTLFKMWEMWRKAVELSRLGMTLGFGQLYVIQPSMYCIVSCINQGKDNVYEARLMHGRCYFCA